MTLPINANFHIHHDKYPKLAKNCLTLKNMFDNNFKETKITNVICANYDVLTGTILVQVLIIVRPSKTTYGIDNTSSKNLLLLGDRDYD